jgi:hypothetical protein
MEDQNIINSQNVYNNQRKSKKEGKKNDNNGDRKTITRKQE